MPVADSRSRCPSSPSAPSSPPSASRGAGWRAGRAAHQWREVDPKRQYVLKAGIRSRSPHQAAAGMATRRARAGEACGGCRGGLWSRAGADPLMNPHAGGICGRLGRKCGSAAAPRCDRHGFPRRAGAADAARRAGCAPGARGAANTLLVTPMLPLGNWRGFAPPSHPSKGRRAFANLHLAPGTSDGTVTKPVLAQEARWAGVHDLAARHQKTAVQDALASRGTHWRCAATSMGPRWRGGSEGRSPSDCRSGGRAARPYPTPARSARSGR